MIKCRSSWYELITEAMKFQGEDWSDVEYNQLTPEDMAEVVTLDYGAMGTGKGFFLWTRDMVYFGYEYDGFPDVRCVPRNPISQRRAFLFS